MWHLEKRDDLPEEYKKIFEKIVELQPPAQHEMGLSSSVQPQPEPISFQTEIAALERIMALLNSKFAKLILIFC